MRRLLTLGLFAAVAAGPAMAQQAPMPGQAPQSADQANAASMPEQGTGAALAPPAAEPNSYPLCSRAVTDECVNPREAGVARGREPLPYWPGRPASEMRGD